MGTKREIDVRKVMFDPAPLWEPDSSADRGRNGHHVAMQPLYAPRRFRRLWSRIRMTRPAVLNDAARIHKGTIGRPADASANGLVFQRKMNQSLQTAKLRQTVIIQPANALGPGGERRFHAEPDGTGPPQAAATSHGLHPWVVFFEHFQSPVGAPVINDQHPGPGTNAKPIQMSQTTLGNGPPIVDGDKDPNLMLRICDGRRGQHLPKYELACKAASKD